MIRTLELQEYLRKEFLQKEKEIKKTISNPKKQEKEIKKLDKVYAKKMKLAKKIFPVKEEYQRIINIMEQDQE